MPSRMQLGSILSSSQMVTKAKAPQPYGPKSTLGLQRTSNAWRGFERRRRLGNSAPHLIAQPTLDASQLAFHDHRDAHRRSTDSVAEQPEQRIVRNHYPRSLSRFDRLRPLLRQASRPVRHVLLGPAWRQTNHVHTAERRCRCFCERPKLHGVSRTASPVSARISATERLAASL